MKECNILQTYEIFLKLIYLKLLQEYLNNEIIGFTDCENNEETAYYTVTDIQGSITEVYDRSSKLVWKSGYTAFGEIAGETVDLIDFDGMYTGCDYDAETGLTYHWNRWRSEDGSAFISEDPARDGANWYGYAGCNPMVYVDRIGLAQSNDYLAPGVAGPQPKPQNQENGFVPLVQNPSGMPQNQTPNITGPSNSVEVVPLYENSDVYNNAVLSQGTKKKRSWFSINVEEPITKFIARNIFGLTPSDYVMLSDRTIVPMSESGTQFAYSERVVDCMSFCVSSLAGITSLIGKGVSIFSGTQIKQAGKSINSGTKYARVDNISNIEKYGQSLGKDGQLFLTDSKTINRLDLTTKSGLQNAEKVLGLPVGQLSNSNINVVTTVNTTGLNIRLPTSGNEFFIPGGVTSGGAPEIVVNPMNIFTDPAVTSIQFIQQVE